jgi:hypothetical protein
MARADAGLVSNAADGRRVLGGAAKQLAGYVGVGTRTFSSWRNFLLDEGSEPGACHWRRDVG